jgi:hypothetical protein
MERKFAEMIEQKALPYEILNILTLTQEVGFNHDELLTLLMLPL